MISAKSPRLNLRCAMTRQHEKAKPMKKRIALKSFSALSFDVMIRQTPARAMHFMPSMLVQRRNRGRDNHQLCKALSPVVFLKTGPRIQSGCRISVGSLGITVKFSGQSNDCARL
jgi:hypothetical protein